MFKNVEKTTMATTTKNFYPCVLMGKAKEDAVFSPTFYWNEISWQILSARQNNVELMVFFGRNNKIDGRGICSLNTETGRITGFKYQDTKGFDVALFRDINSMKVFRSKADSAFKYTVNLVHYFGRVNEAEYEKECVLKEAAFRFAQKSEKHNETSKKEDSSYEPDREKAIYVGHTQTGEEKTRNYTVDSWQKAGHYRHYKSGKVVYIKPTICKPKNK